MKKTGLFLFLIKLPLIFQGQPNFLTQQFVSNCIIFQDVTHQNIYYYVDGGLELEYDVFERPNFKFVRATYSGSHMNNDSEAKFNFHQISFTVATTSIEPRILEEIKRNLGKNNEVILKRLPLQKIKAEIAIPLNKDSTHIIEGGVFENSTDEANWSRRNFTMNLNLIDGKLLWDLLTNGQGILNVVYSYWALGVHSNQITIESEKDSSYILEMDKLFSATSTMKESEPKTELVYHNVLTINIDTSLHKGLFRHIDLSQPGLVVHYPVLNIQFEDFVDGIQGDLYERRIEILADGFSKPYRQYVQAQAIFNLDRPEEYFQQIYFKQPVRTDKPFKIKITDVDTNGNIIRSIGPYIVRKWGFLNLSNRK